MFLKKLSGMFIPDLDCFPIPDPGVEEAPDPGPATLLGTMLAFMDPDPETELNPDPIPTEPWCYELTHLDDDLWDFHVGLLGRHQVSLVASCKIIETSTNNR
jgi:hypothetical protein